MEASRQCARALCVWLLGVGCSGGASTSDNRSAQAAMNGTNGSRGGSGSPSTSPGLASSAPDAGESRVQSAADFGSPSPTPLPPAGNFAAMQKPPDPTIAFNWQETRPGRGECQPGSYSGTFTCAYLMPGADPSSAIEVTGPVVFTLTKSQSGEFLEISDGHLDGVAQFIIGFTSRLSGKLDCNTNGFDAMALDGVYGFGDPKVLPIGAFEGSLAGTLDRSSVTLSGVWSLMITGPGGSCDGPWTATWMP